MAETNTTWWSNYPPILKKQPHAILVKDNMCPLWAPEAMAMWAHCSISASTPVPGMWRGKTRTSWMNEVWAQWPRQLFPIYALNVHCKDITERRWKAFKVQQSQTFLAPGTGFMADNFSTDWGVGKDGLGMWCWRILLSIPWIARRSNQSILQEINPEYSLEGLMLKLKLQYFGHLMWRTDSSEDPGAGEDWRQEEKRMTEDGNIDSRDMSLSKLQKIVKGREAWSAAVHGVTKCQDTT